MDTKDKRQEEMRKRAAKRRIENGTRSTSASSGANGTARTSSGQRRNLTRAQIVARRRRRRRQVMIYRAICVGVVLAIILVLVLGIVIINKVKKSKEEKELKAQQEAQMLAEQAASAKQTFIDEGKRMALGYDYDGAIAYLQGNAEYANDPEVLTTVAEIEAQKSELVPVDTETVPHVFFHTLVAEPAITWNLTGEDEYKMADYNEVMTTIDEFNAIMQQMYDRGYVLVNIRDLIVENEDGTFSKNENLLLPPGKKPFVLSQDDVCYYFYMIGDGYADKLIVGQDGKPTNEYIQADGTVVTGSYDVVPCLNDFIEEHPDFSYKGAKGILALTGYNGIFGYRTDPDLAKTAEEGNEYATEYGVFNTEEEIEKVKPVIECLKNDGWEFASHSYGHISYGSSFEKVKEDADKWQARVGNIIGPTDILIFPFGTDIGDWHSYADDNEKYNYLKNQGFKYFCNVDSNEYWVQLDSDYVRQGRINLDGFRMYQDLYGGSDKLSHLFNVEEVFDYNRPDTGLDQWQGNQS